MHARVYVVSGYFGLRPLRGRIKSHFRSIRRIAEPSNPFAHVCKVHDLFGRIRTNRRALSIPTLGFYRRLMCDPIEEFTLPTPLFASHRDTADWM